jgi:hypothetical protein
MYVIDVAIEEKHENLSILSLLIILTPKLCKKIPQSQYTPYILIFFTKNYTPYIKEWREYYLYRLLDHHK